MRFNIYIIATLAGFLLSPVVAHHYGASPDAPFPGEHHHHGSHGDLGASNVARELVERLIEPAIARALDRRGLDSEHDFLERRLILTAKSCGDARTVVSHCTAQGL